MVDSLLDMWYAYTLSSFMRTKINGRKITAGLYRMPGSRFWWYRWSENGQRFAVSLKTEDESTAILEKAKIVADVQRRGSASYRAIKGGGDGASTGAEAIVDRYLDDAKNRTRKPMRPETAKTVGFVLKRFLRESDIADIRALSTGTMQAWLKKLKQKGRASETLRSYTRDLKAWQTWLRKNNIVRADQLPDLDQYDKPPTGRKNWISQEQIDQLIAAAFKKPKKNAPANTAAIPDNDLRFALHCAANAGLRRAEISEARVEWFDLERGVIEVFSNEDFRTKDNDARTVPLKKAFREFLKEYLKDREPGYVLAPEVTKGKSKYRFDCNRRLMSHLRNCKAKATFHDLRRSFASNLVSKGESIYLVAKWLGDGVSVVERSYGHVAPQSGNIDR
jgi:integrase